MPCSFCAKRQNARLNIKNSNNNKQKANSRRTTNKSVQQMSPPSFLTDSVYDNPQNGMVPMKNKKNASFSIYDMPPVDASFPFKPSKGNAF